MEKIIRVFPRRTSMTPTDTLAFIGAPPLWRPEVDRVDISCTFTWDVEEARRLQEAWAQYYPVVKLGGPAIKGSSGEFIPGMYLKEGATITSRGCPRRCPWCLVPEYEGAIRTLEIKPGWVVQDNNFLATPKQHQARVFAMLREQRRAVSFPGGLDARLLTGWAVVQLSTLKIKQVFLAADNKGSLPVLREAVGRLGFLSRRQLRCYVLIAYGGETIKEAERRLEAVWDIGCLPFAQLFQPADPYIDYPPEWKALARTWSRPAAMFALHKEERGSRLVADPPGVETVTETMRRWR